MTNEKRIAEYRDFIADAREAAEDYRRCGYALKAEHTEQSIKDAEAMILRIQRAAA